MDPDEPPKYQQLFVHIDDLTYIRDILLLFYIEIQRRIYQLLRCQIFYEVIYSIRKTNKKNNEEQVTRNVYITCI